MIKDVFFRVLFSSVKDASIALGFLCLALRIILILIPIFSLLLIVIFSFIDNFGLYHQIIASIGDYGL